MKKILFFAVALLFVVGCSNNQSTQSLSNTSYAPHESARSSLDFWGTYKGVLPCADCIETIVQLELTMDNRFNYRATYVLNNGDAVVEQNGTFAWLDDGFRIRLEKFHGGPGLYFVVENRLFHLDQDGNRIQGDLADMYILNRIK